MKMERNWRNNIYPNSFGLIYFGTILFAGKCPQWSDNFPQYVLLTCIFGSGLEICLV